MSGWVKEWRSIKNSKVAHAAPCTREVWGYLRREANHADHKSNGAVIKRGQLFRNVPMIQDDLHWFKGWAKQTYTNDSVRYAIGWLCDEDMITTQRSSRGILITVCNYEIWQGSSNGDSSLDPHLNPILTPSQPHSINKEEEEEKERASVKKEKASFFAANSDELQLANFCIEKIKSNHPTVKFTSDKKQQFADMFEKMVRIDKMSIDKIKTMIVWVTSHRDYKSNFSWAEQFMSPLKMRKRNKDGIRFTDMWESAMSRSKGSLDGKPADMTAVQWDRIRDMPFCKKCKTKEHMKIMSRSGRMSKWYCQQCNTAETVQR